MNLPGLVLVLGPTQVGGAAYIRAEVVPHAGKPRAHLQVYSVVTLQLLVTLASLGLALECSESVKSSMPGTPL